MVGPAPSKFALRYRDLPDGVYDRHLAEARAGDRGSLCWLLSLEQEWIASHAERATAMSTTRWTARDLVQECCLAVLRAPGRPNSESRAQFRSWLKTILRNQIMNELRRLRPCLLEEEKDAGAKYLDRVTDISVLFASRPEARRDLPFHFEAALVLRDFCGCSFDTIARVLDCSTKKATYRMRSRALDAMKDEPPPMRA